MSSSSSSLQLRKRNLEIQLESIFKRCTADETGELHATLSDRIETLLLGIEEYEQQIRQEEEIQRARTQRPQRSFADSIRLFSTTLSSGGSRRTYDDDVPVPLPKPVWEQISHINEWRACPDADKCSICLDDFEEGSRVTKLPCDHYYHTTCIERHFSTSPKCPCCRKDIRECITYGSCTKCETNMTYGDIGHLPKEYDGPKECSKCYTPPPQTTTTTTSDTQPSANPAPEFGSGAVSILDVLSSLMGGSHGSSDLFYATAEYIPGGNDDNEDDDYEEEDDDDDDVAEDAAAE